MLWCRAAELSTQGGQARLLLKVSGCKQRYFLRRPGIYGYFSAKPKGPCPRWTSEGAEASNKATCKGGFGRGLERARPCICDPAVVPSWGRGLDIQPFPDLRLHILPTQGMRV